MPKATFDVWATCAAELTPQPTHARMSEQRFARFRGELVFWCANCRAAHVSAASQLTLSRSPPIAEAAPNHALGGELPPPFASA